MTAPQNPRELRGLAILSQGPGAVAKVKEGLYTVKSQSGQGRYAVALGRDEQWYCDCPDFTTRNVRCKHVHAVRYYLEIQKHHPDGTTTTERVPLTYRQAWNAYNEAQKSEVRLFDQILSELVAGVVDPRPPQARGQPRAPLADTLYATVQKTYSQLSLRRAYSLFRNAAERGQIGRPPSFTVPSKVLNRADITPILHDLIAKAALPLAALEKDFAVDSSGFRTNCFGSYCQERHGASRINVWLKAHVIAGTQTHVIPRVIVTDGNGADCPQFPPLVTGTVSAGFVMEEVYADKGYLSRENMEAAHAAGATPYIPFKANSTGRTRGSPVWARMYHLWQADPEGFYLHYHGRSNAESVFGAIKKKLGETLKSRRPTAQVNELLCKVLAYNITVLIHEMFEHGVVPGFAPKAVQAAGV